MMKRVWTKGYASYMTFRNSIFLLILILGSFSHSSGQERAREIPPLKDRLFYGGNFSLQFGTFTDIEVSPVIGLWVLPRVAVAAGPHFQYYKVFSSSTLIYGGKSYAEVLFLQDLHNVIPLGIHLGLFLHGEYEALSLESAAFQSPPYDSRRFMTHTFLAGGGIRQQIGKRSSLNFTFLWTLNDPGYNIYGSPEIRVSFMF